MIPAYTIYVTAANGDGAKITGDKAAVDAVMHVLDHAGVRYDENVETYDFGFYQSPPFSLGQRVEGGDTVEDYDTGTVTHIAGDEITVAWKTGIRTTQPSSMLRPEGSNPHRAED